MCRIDWVWDSNFGSFLTATAISFFAISTIYDKINLNKHEARLKHLYILHNLLLPVEIVDSSGRVLKERDPTKSIDTALIWSLFNTLTLDDWNALNITNLPIVSNKIPDSEVDTMKRCIHMNRSKIPDLIKKIGHDFRRLKWIYRFVILMFILGLIIQLISLAKTS